MDDERVFAKFTGSGDAEALPELVERLLDEQRRVWPDLARGLQALEAVRVRNIATADYPVVLQYNPVRMVSTGAKVDPESIARRRCFLCTGNLPPSQQGVLFRDEYLILCNPAPIFRGHYTIAHLEHRPQTIRGNIATMLLLARDLGPAFLVFYNGARCGASAPDHLHFQASPAASIPAHDQSFLESHTNGSVRINGIQVTLLKDTDRSILTYRAPSADEATLALERILRSAEQVEGTKDEPLVNILASWSEQQWRLVVILRSKHRPDAYFRRDEGKLLVSPAAVDMGGLVITPREEDFNRLNAETVAAIYREVSLEPAVALSVLEAVR